MTEEKKEINELKEKLFYKSQNAALQMNGEEIGLADAFCEGYKAFLNRSKTEREVVSFIKEAAASHGFETFDASKKYRAGDKALFVNREKAAVLVVFGKRSLGDGIKISASHIDSPRLDLKPNPLYEDNGLALFKTHYYGGIKKYQWSAIPLSLHGIIFRKDGSSVSVNIGENENDPQFVITDLLPHLGSEQGKRKLGEGLKGEELNILIGSRPFKAEKESELVKLNILSILNEKYGITEKDFLSAELEAVPAFKAADIGFDRSMIGAYGHDDRVCAYPSLMASLDCETPEFTTVSVFADKEETGSNGNTGLDSAFLSHFIEDLAKGQGVELRDVLRNSECLSADVNAAFDPTFPGVHDSLNAAFCSKGLVVTKYTGSRGKSGSSDASAEFMSKIRTCFDNSGVIWQTGELGKVDEGGGGTVAAYVAALDMEVVDVGVPVLSMHSPFEVVAKLDVFMTYKGIRAFFEQK